MQEPSFWSTDGKTAFQDLHRSALPELKVPLPQNKHLLGSEQESLLQTLQTCAVFQAAAFSGFRAFWRPEFPWFLVIVQSYQVPSLLFSPSNFSTAYLCYSLQDIYRRYILPLQRLLECIELGTSLLPYFHQSIELLFFSVDLLLCLLQLTVACCNCRII